MTLQDLIDLRNKLDDLVGTHKRHEFFDAVFRGAARKVCVYRSHSHGASDEIADAVAKLGLRVYVEQLEMFPGWYSVWVVL